MKAGLPERFQNEAARLRMEVEMLEAQISEYAVEVAR
jgi:NH3-dependent NAD+ synthetase